MLLTSGQKWQTLLLTSLSRMSIATVNGNFTLLLTLLLKFQSWGLIFARCNMQYCCSSTFWQVKSADAVFTSVRYTPTQICQKNWTRWEVRWSTPDKQSVIPPNLSDEVTKIRCEMKYPARLSDIPPSPNIEFSGLAISHCYWHLVVKNGNFTLLLTSSGQECQFHTATDI